VGFHEIEYPQHFYKPWVVFPRDKDNTKEVFSPSLLLLKIGKEVL
jgi:hypothetical protein